MTQLQALLYVVAVILLVNAAFGVGGGRVFLALLGGAVALLAYALPGIAVLFT